MAQPNGQLIENFLPPVQSAGLNTNKATYLGGTLEVAGVATFDQSPVFSAGRLSTVLNETANATLTVSQSGATVLFNSTTGVQVILPTPASGVEYTFVVTQAPSTGTHGVRVAGSTFLIGGLNAAKDAGTSGVYTANGTSTAVVSLNGTTQGGIAGSTFKVVGINATQWQVSGTTLGSGALATPFS